MILPPGVAGSAGAGASDAGGADTVSVAWGVSAGAGASEAGVAGSVTAGVSAGVVEAGV